MHSLKLSTLFVVLFLPSTASADRILNLSGSPLEPYLMLGGHQQILVDHPADEYAHFTSNPEGVVSFSLSPEGNWRMHGIALGTTEVQAHARGKVIATAQVEVRELDTLTVRTWSTYEDASRELHILEGMSVTALIDAASGGDALPGYGDRFLLLVGDRSFAPVYSFGLDFQVVAELERGVYPMRLQTELATYPGLTLHVHGTDEVTYSFEDTGASISIVLRTADGARVFGARTEVEPGGGFGEIATTIGGDGYIYAGGPYARETRVWFLIGKTRVSTLIHGSLLRVTETAPPGGCQVCGTGPAGAVVTAVATLLVVGWLWRRSRTR